MARQDPRAAHQISFAKIDIDRLRNINDTLGRAGGIILLQQFAGRLVACETPSASLNAWTRTALHFWCAVHLVTRYQRQHLPKK